MQELFKVKVAVDIDYDSQRPPGFTYESYSSEAVVAYGLSIEMRDWGIKGLSFSVPEQELTLNLQLVEKEDEDAEDFECKVSLKECKIDIGLIRPSSDLAPLTLALKLKNFKLLPISKSGLNFEAEAEGELQFPDVRD